MLLCQGFFPKERKKERKTTILTKRTPDGKIKRKTAVLHFASLCLN